MPDGVHGCVLAVLCLSAETLSSHGHRQHGLEWREGGGEEVRREGGGEEGGREAEPRATVDGGIRPEVKIYVEEGSQVERSASRLLDSGR